MLNPEPRHALAAPPPSASSAQLVVGVGVVMVAAQLIFRAWAIYPSWFFTDDYRLMLDAHDRDLDLAYAFQSFDSHLMPLARVQVWLVTEAGPLNWGLAASITLGLQLAASLACLWMLVTLFSARWLILSPLALYLTSVLTMPAFMWWAPSLNQLPFQVSLFCAVATWVTYLRHRRLRYLVLTLVSVVIGVGFYEKALILGFPLAFLALGYFASGGPLARLRHVWRRYRPAVVTGALLAGGYLAFYASRVPPPFESSANGSFVADDIANSMLGTALPAGLVGGPWRWWRTTPPIVLADPPDWAVHVSWMLVAVVVLYAVLRRSRAMRGWALLAGYVLLLYLVLVVSRGQIYGALSGLEYRYLTDAVCVAVLAIGLAFAEVPGAVESSAPRAAPLLVWRAGAPVAIGLTAAVAVGGLVSSYLYVGYWHRDNASDAYVHNLQESLGRHQGSAALPRQVLPAEVMPSYSEPDNASDVFVPLLETRARFPEVSDNLMVIDTNGEVVPALVAASTVSAPGPVGSCGWQVTSGSVTIPLGSETYSWPWWVRIGYLSSARSPVTVTVGETRHETEVQKGLGALFVKAPGVFDSLTVGGLDPGTTLCIDGVQVGDPVPARSLE